MYYKTRVRKIEAVQWTGHNSEEVTVFVGEHAIVPYNIGEMDNSIFFSVFSKTLGSTAWSAPVGYYILKIDEEFSSMHPDDFHDDYEEDE